MAVATAHTVHLVLLPDSSHLGQLPNKPLKLKTSTIGRTTHVLSQPTISSILWHPCGVSGNCLVTVTTDAIVRLWEFGEGNRWSSDSPSIAIDLKKLAKGVSCEDNFAPDRGKNRTFSSDDVGMEVASARFGGQNTNEESPWAALTLWVAMKAGDIYALCPLLPSKWQPCSGLLPSLSTAVVAKAAALGMEAETDAHDSQQQKDQYQWVQDLDGQEPWRVQSATSNVEAEAYHRPSEPGAIPRLQGPFQLVSDEDDEIELCDIYVIAAKAQSGEDNVDDESEIDGELDNDGLSASVISLMTRTGKCYICLDLEGIEGQWLPRKPPKVTSPAPSVETRLVLLETLETMRDREQNDHEWPTFSPDVESRHSFFTTHSRGVYFFSLDPWLSNLEKEFHSTDPTGASFRLDIFRNGPGTFRERILSFDQAMSHSPKRIVPACVAVEDSDLGYFLLTTANSQPQAATLDRPYHLPEQNLDGTDGKDSADPVLPDMAQLVLGPTRTPFQPPSTLYSPSTLPSFLESHIQARHRHLTSRQVRLSPATLDLMTAAHRILSRETHQLGLAAADLFRRCERLVEELHDQIRRVAECSDRTDEIIGEDDETSDQSEAKHSSTQAALEQRLKQALERQSSLQERFESLKKRVHGSGGRPLSDKEKSWIQEVKATVEAVGTDSEIHETNGDEDDREDNGDDEVNASSKEDEEEDEQDDQTGKEVLENLPLNLHERAQRIHDLKDDLVARSSTIVEINADESQPSSHEQTEDNAAMRGIPRDVRARKVAQVMQMLDREYVIPFSSTDISSILPINEFMFLASMSESIAQNFQLIKMMDIGQV